MHSIDESNLLLRVPCELPKGLRLLADEFHKGWALARSMDASRLEKKIQARGWNFIKIADGSVKSGVGDTSQEAIAAALRHSLRSIGEHSNVVEIKQIEMTQYHWFCLAKVRVIPYRIQLDAALQEFECAGLLPIVPPHGRVLDQSAANQLHSVGTMPMLKELLVLPGSIDEGGAQ